MSWDAVFYDTSTPGTVPVQSTGKKRDDASIVGRDILKFIPTSVFGPSFYIVKSQQSLMIYIVLKAEQYFCIFLFDSFKPRTVT